MTNLYNAAASSSSVSILIPGIRNARSQAPSSSFSVATTDNSGTGIDNLSSGFTITMTSVLDLQGLVIQNTNSDKVNGVFDPYKVIVTAQTPTANGDKVVLQFPTSMTFPSLSSSLT